MDDDTLYHSTQDAWDEIWDAASMEQERKTLMYRRAQEYFRVFIPYLPRDQIILEAGCGMSVVVEYLRAQGLNVVGLDYVEAVLHKARAHNPTLPLHVGDIHALPYADASMGGYLSYGVLEHFPHGPMPALVEAHRVLCVGGVMVLTIPYPNVVQRLIRLRRRCAGKTARTQEDFYETTYTRRALERYVRQAGFEVVLSMPTAHSFTLWGLGGPFRAPGYYQTSALAERLGAALKRVLPWAFNFSTMIIARKV